MTQLDPAIERALRLLEGADLTPAAAPAGNPRREPAEAGREPAEAGGRFPAGSPPSVRGRRNDGGRRLADDLAGRLLAEEWPRAAWLDVGLWGRPVYRAAAEAALRLQAVALTGDELA